MKMKQTLLFVLGMLFSNWILAQITVSGKITASDDGSSIPFANIQVKGDKSKGTVANNDGVFTLPNVPSQPH